MINGSERYGKLTSPTGLTLNGTFYLPRLDKIDPIQNLDTGLWLTVRDDKAAVGTEVTQEPKWTDFGNNGNYSTDNGLPEITDGPNNKAHSQKWRRSPTDENGYFTLKNTWCKKFLMASRGIYPDKIVVERMLCTCTQKDFTMCTKWNKLES